MQFYFSMVKDVEMVRPDWYAEIVGLRTLPQIAQEVHSTTTGAFDRDHGKQQDDIAVLKYALDNWEPSIFNRNIPYEEAVRNLIEVVLDECERYDAMIDQRG